MGQSNSGSMIVGAHGSEISIPEEVVDSGGDTLELSYLSEFAEHLEDITGHSTEMLCEHYDAGDNRSYMGFSVPDVEVSEMKLPWMLHIHKLAKLFEEHIGVKASLIGSQNIT